MAGLWYRAGTVAVTNGSKKVVGTGTTWKSGVSKPDKGHLVWGPDGKPYELDYVESDTVLYLVTAYSGVTSSGMAYSIDISRSGSNSAFSRDLSAFVAYHQLQMDGWQQLLTGTGDVTLTAPDGTKLTVPSWEKIMNAGAGVVAQAKTEADRAKSEASKAAASATAAGDVVAASALPLPDVWAPLSDSLRLITGYGRDVLVGSDVVARMVNFSRSTTKTYRSKDGGLKVAAVNEPAFEAEGLLIEGQSSNIITAMPMTGNNATVEPINIPGWEVPVYRLTVPAGVDGYISVITQKNIGPYTASIFARVEAGSPPGGASLQTNYLNSGGITVGSAVPIAGATMRRFAATCQNDAVGNTHNYIFIRNAGGAAPCSVVVSGWQLENLPFATSYIPTNGSVVTRAADMCDIPNGPLNYRSAYAGIGPMTISVSFNMLSGVGQQGRYLLTAENTGGDSSAHSLQATESGYAVNIGSARAESPNSKVAKYIVYPANSTFSVDGASYQPYSGLTSTYQVRPDISVGRRGVTNTAFLFGHVRNIRIYFSKLSAAQFKAIAP